MPQQPGAGLVGITGVSQVDGLVVALAVHPADDGTGRKIDTAAFA